MPAQSSQEQELIDFLAGFALDPHGFVLAAFPWTEPGPLQEMAGPRAWQADILRSIGEALRAGYSPGQVLMPVLRAIASGHGIGKSALISWIIWWALSTMADTKVVITANTEPQLRTKTWPELSKWARMAINAHWFKVQGLSVVASNPERAKTWRCDAVTWSETNLEAFAGLHNQGRRIVLLFDEASGIADKVWETAEGALTDEGTEIVWLAFGNPTQPSGKFFECFGKQRDRWQGRQIDSRQVEGTNKALIDQWLTAYGEDSDFFRVRVRGMFPRAGSMQFISQEQVDAAVKREPVPLLTDPVVIGVDVARSGTARSVIAVRRGRDARLHPWVKLRGASDTMVLAAKVAELALSIKADAIMVDGGGVGGGVVDRLRQLGFQVFDVQFGAKADRTPMADEVHNYANKRSEMWGNMREWLKSGTIPDDPELHADLVAPEYGFAVRDGRDVIQLERKQDMEKRGHASPDDGDALALTFAYPVTKAVPQGAYQRPARVLSTEYDLYA
jgi:hypothetical protein